MNLFTGRRRVGCSDNFYGLWYFMLKTWHAVFFGIASTRSQVGTVGYVLGKQRRMFSILLTRVGEACQGVEQLYLGKMRLIFFFYSMSAARDFSFYCQASKILICCTSQRVINFRLAQIFLKGWRSRFLSIWCFQCTQFKVWCLYS